jgi:hypothetical protein
MRTSILLSNSEMHLDDRTLVSGFIAGDAARTRELLERLMPLMNHELRRRWPALRAQHDDILGAIAVTLVTWREEVRDGESKKLSEGESLDSLAARLVNVQARKARRALSIERDMRDAHRHQPAATDQLGPEAAALRAEERTWVEDGIAELPPSHAQTLRACLAHDSGQGPPPHRALDCRKATARKRIQRAGEALFEVLLRKGVNP